MAFDFLTVFLTTGSVMFLAVYFTPFVPVVTLGGTVLGAAVTGLAAALIGLLVRRVQPHQRLTRAAIELVGITLVVTDTARYLPGWRITHGIGTMVFLLVLCLVQTVLVEVLYRTPANDMTKSAK
ncbi:MAG: hypothetical protein I3I94_08575 [Acidaminococcaceae bacterium]|nr:hypothetical protein [Acidaminococcaceae bacterium]HAY61344.1 hypothetical protein [Acidaminococcaceae bacterium]HCJ91483.1 hypothetical protein [Acidaminococcaceae bacterium]